MNLRHWRWLGIGLVTVAAVAFGVALSLTRTTAAVQPASSRSLTVVDDLDRTITLALPIRRTVVFNRYDVEFVRAVAGMETVVGLDNGAAKERDYWPTVTDAMIVGQGQSEVNYEKIIALRPDIVLMPRNGDWQKAAQTLAPFNIPVVVLTGWDVLKHEANIDLLGQIYERPEQAEKLNAFYVHYRDLLRTRLKNVPRKRVYLEEVADYKTVLKGSGWHDMIELGGGTNVFGDVDIQAGKAEGRGAVQGFVVDPEAILVRKPDLIIKLQPGQYAPHTRAFSKSVLLSVSGRPGFNQLNAVKTGEVYHMSYYLAGGCSKVIGALQIAKWLYPDRFSDIDPDAAMRQWIEEFQGVPYPSGYSVSLNQVRQ